MELGKKGFIKGSTGIINGVLIGLLIIVLLIEASAVLIPQVQTSATTLCNSGIPLASLWKSNGVVILAITMALVLAVFTMVLPKGK